MVQCLIHRNSKVIMHHQESMKVIRGLLRYDDFYIHYSKLSFTYSRNHTFHFVSTGVMSNISPQKNARTPQQNISLRNLCNNFWLEETTILDMQMSKLPMISGYDKQNTEYVNQTWYPCTMLKHARYIVICTVLDELWISKYIICFSILYWNK